jgi:hypothetical protein
MGQGRTDLSDLDFLHLSPVGSSGPWRSWVALIVGFSKGGWSAIGNLSVPILSLVVNPLTAAALLLPVSRQ